MKRILLVILVAATTTGCMKPCVSYGTYTRKPNKEVKKTEKNIDKSNMKFKKQPTLWAGVLEAIGM